MKTVCIMDSVSRANGGIFQAERRLQQHLLGKAGIDVRVVGLRDDQTDADRAAWAPIEPRAVPIRGPRIFGYAPGFEEALEETGADLGYLVGLWKYPSLATSNWSRRAKKPVMIAPHGMLDPWALRHSGLKKKVAGRLFQDRQLREAACLRALCQAEADAMRAYGLRNPICIIPNGIDLPSRQEEIGPRHGKFPANGRVLLYLGRLHPKKGLVPLLEAWSRLEGNRGDWTLAIGGWDQGGHEDELKRQATDLGIPWADDTHPDNNPTLLFIGPQFGADKAACYRSCDAFILPSFSEGLPMVLLEAWAYAKPVLMTPACNLPEGRDAGAGIPIEATPKGIESGLNVLLPMPDDELAAIGGSGRALVEERFSWPQIATEMGAVQHWLVEGGPAPRSVLE